MPPSLARAIAKVASVTVSMADDSIGIFNVISLVSLLRISTSRGNTCEKAGNNNTSSNVSPSPKNFEGDFDLPVGVFILAMCKDRAVDKCAQIFIIPGCPGGPGWGAGEESSGDRVDAGGGGGMCLGKFSCNFCKYLIMNGFQKLQLNFFFEGGRERAADHS